MTVKEQARLDGFISLKLNELVWRCIHKKELSEQEKERLIELARILETKEKHNEEALKKADLSREEAKRLYHESAAFIRTIMDLRECETGKVKLKITRANPPPLLRPGSSLSHTGSGAHP